MVQSPAVGSILQDIEHLDDALAQARAQLLAFYAPNVPRAFAGALFKMLERAHDTLDLLRERVVDLAVAEPTVETRIAGLRARLGVALRQLGELTRTEHEVTAPIWSGPFGSASDVARHATSRLSRVDTSFLGEATAVNRGAAAARAYIEMALEAAERTLDALGKDAPFASFIAAAASVSSPRFRRASRTLAALLGVPLAPSVTTVARRAPC